MHSLLTHAQSAYSCTVCLLMHSLLTHAQSAYLCAACTVCLLMHSLLTHAQSAYLCAARTACLPTRWWAGSASSTWKTRFYGHLHTWSNHATDHLLLGKSVSRSRSMSVRSVSVSVSHSHSRPTTLSSTAVYMSPDLYSNSMYANVFAGSSPRAPSSAGFPICNSYDFMIIWHCSDLFLPFYAFLSCFLLFPTFTFVLFSPFGLDRISDRSNRF